MSNEPTPREIADFIDTNRGAFGDGIPSETESNRMNEQSANYWGAKLAPPAPEYTPGSGDAYRAWAAGNTTANSLPQGWVAAYNGQGQQPQNRPEYADSTRTLADYASRGTQSKHLMRGDESPSAYLARMGTISRHLDELPAAEKAAVEAAITEAQERLNAQPGDHESLRAQLDNRADGTGVGLYGKDMLKEYQAREAAAAASYRSHVTTEYQSVAPAVPRVNLAGIRAADEQARADAVASRYSHAPLARPSGEGLFVTAP